MPVKNNISIFFPLRSGSQRVVRKNTRPFLNNGKSIFQLKMTQIVKLADHVNEIVISTDDEEVILQAAPFLSDKIKIIKRPKELCLSSTKVLDLINYVPKVTKCDHILWLHATAPFIDTADYLEALNLYNYNVLNGSYDSLMSVNKIQQFIWSKEQKKVINVDRKLNPWPNTQDLEPLYEINHALYISSRNNYLELQDRIGLNPYLYVNESVKRLDIDWPDDFNLCQKISNQLFD